jgi:hypothetical protein
VKRKAVLIVLVGALVIAGVAFAAVSYFFGSSEDKAISLVPSDAFLYGNVFIRPSNGQKMAIEDILEAAGQTPDELQDSFSQLVDRGLEECDASFEDDVDPWLGSQVSFFFVAPDEATEDPDGAALIQTKDEAGAEDFLDKCREVLDLGGSSFQTGSGSIEEQPLIRPNDEPEAKTYDGFDYRLYESDVAIGFVEGFLVAGTEGGFRAAVDVAQGEESLAGSARFEAVRSKVTTDNLAMFYLNPGPALEAAREVGQIGPDEEQAFEVFGDAFARPSAATFHATSEGFVFESASPWASDGPLSPVLDILEQETGLDDLPSDAWFAAGFPAVGTLADVVYQTALQFQPEDTQAAVGQFEAQSGLDFEQDVVDGLDGVRLFVSNGIGLGTRGAVVIETSNEGTTGRLLAAIERAVKSDPDFALAVQPLGLEGYEDGFTLAVPGAPEAFHVVVFGKRIVGGLGESAVSDALQSDEPLRDSQVFKNARELLGDGYEPYVFLDLKVVTGALENLFALTAPDNPTEDVEPILDAISHLTIGAKRDGDYILQRVVIGAEQEEQ